jgi:transposase
MKRVIPRYDAAFKKRAVKLALGSGQSIGKTADELGINANTLYRWISVAQEPAEKSVSKDLKNDLYDEVMKLRQENARLLEEREILKKAATFFAQQSK